MQNQFPTGFSFSWLYVKCDQRRQRSHIMLRLVLMDFLHVPHFHVEFCFFICIISFVLLKEFPTQNVSIKARFTFSSYQEVGRFGNFESISSEITLLLHGAFLAKSSLIIYDTIKWHCMSSFISRKAINSKNKRQHNWYV